MIADMPSDEDVALPVVLSRAHSGSSDGRSAADFTAAAAAAGTPAATASAAAAAAPQSASVPPAPAAPAAADIPSRHLWLGNILQNVDRQAVEVTFSRFGPLESTRVFPDKHFAFVNYLSIEVRSHNSELPRIHTCL